MNLTKLRRVGLPKGHTGVPSDAAGYAHWANGDRALCGRTMDKDYRPIPDGEPRRQCKG